MIAILIFIAVLAGLVFFHELGHFMAAKFFGVRVDEFGIGFPPRLWSVKRGETLYSFNLLPLGGFVKMLGETSQGGTQANADPRALTNKPYYAQAVVCVAGIVMNIIIAWAILSMGFVVGLPTSPEAARFGSVVNINTNIAGVMLGSPAEVVGLRAGDQVLRVESATAALEPGANSHTLEQFIASHQDENIAFTVLRNEGSFSSELAFIAKPSDGFVEGRKAIGVSLADQGMLQLPVPLAILQGAVSTWDMTLATTLGMGSMITNLFKGNLDASQVSGPIGITVIGASAVREGFAALAILTAFISINLAVLNLLPVPVLDGGRLVMIAIEAVIRRPLPEKAVLYVTLVGLLLLVSLMILVSVQDIRHLVG